MLYFSRKVDIDFLSRLLLFTSEKFPFCVLEFFLVSLFDHLIFLSMHRRTLQKALCGYTERTMEYHFGQVQGSRFSSSRGLIHILSWPMGLSS